MKTDLKTIENGYSLVELLTVMAVSSLLMSAVLYTYINFVNTDAKESAQDTINSEVNAVFRMLEKEVIMAGYGLPKQTRVASHNDCTAGGEVFCKANTDRLFLGDGFEVLKDVTGNHEDDGQISASDMTKIAEVRNGTVGGYRAQLASDVASGSSSATLADLNINSGDENTTTPPYDNDFKPETAFIIADSSRVEGHRIDTVNPDTTPPSISLLAKDLFSHVYLQGANHSVVPATCWYIRSDPDGKKYSDGTPVYWLYRNGERVMSDVEDFQIQYGYDAKNDGIQWSDVVPPDNIATGSYDDWAPKPDGETLDFTHLKVIRINMTIKFDYKGNVRTTSYQTVMQLRN